MRSSFSALRSVTLLCTEVRNCCNWPVGAATVSRISAMVAGAFSIAAFNSAALWLRFFTLLMNFFIMPRELHSILEPQRHPLPYPLPQGERKFYTPDRKSVV